MSGLLICAAVVAAVAGWALAVGAGWCGAKHDEVGTRLGMPLGLALIAAALWLAYASRRG